MTDMGFACSCPKWWRPSLEPALASVPCLMLPLLKPKGARALAHKCTVPSKATAPSVSLPHA